MWIKVKEKHSYKNIFLNSDHVVKIYSEGDTIVAETSNSDSELTDRYVIFENRIDPLYVYDMDKILTKVLTSIESEKRSGNEILDLKQTIKTETCIKRKRSQLEIENLSIKRNKNRS